jgi:hypothetical protein
VVNKHMKLSLVLMRRMARADLFKNARRFDSTNSATAQDGGYEDDFEDEGESGESLTMDTIRRVVEDCKLREKLEDEELRRARRDIEKMGADEKLAAAALATKKEEVADQGRAQASAGGTKHEAKIDAL